MEHRPLNDLLLASRENVVRTYVELGRAVRESTVVDAGLWTICRSPYPVALANFVIGLTIPGGSSATQDAMRMLCAEALMRPVFRVFRLPLDEPEDIDYWLGRSGFGVQNRLHHMAAVPEAGYTGPEPLRCRTRSERRMVAAFAANQFAFGRMSLARTIVIGCTANSPHELRYVENDGKIVAAVMLVETPRAVGVYNLCVDAALRGRGYGTELMRWVLTRAETARTPVVLQCEGHLAPWYESLGFKKIGVQESWAIK